MKLVIENLEKYLLGIDQQLSKQLPQARELKEQVKQSNGEDQLLQRRYQNLEANISRLQMEFYLESIRKFFLGAS